jgi:protocatechuate 3,4-dioxygenase beta subunit
MAFAVLMLALESAAVPQTGKKGEVKERTVDGMVIDHDGKPVNHAIVQLKNVRTAQIRSYITEEKGNFSFNGLNPDIDYEVRAELDGNASPTKTLSSYDGRKAFTVTLKLAK